MRRQNKKSLITKTKKVLIAFTQRFWFKQNLKTTRKCFCFIFENNTTKTKCSKNRVFCCFDGRFVGYFGCIRGGNTNNSTNAGAFYFNVNNNLTNTNTNIGFRPSLIYTATINP